MNSGYATDPDQNIIAAPVSSEVTVLEPTSVDVSQGSRYRASLSPTVTGVASLVNCTASVVPASTNVSVTGSAVGAGSLEFTLNDGDGGVDSNTLTLDIVPSSGGSIAAYSGSNELGTQANPAIAPFGTHLFASVAGVGARELFSELYGARWDFGDINAVDIAHGTRIEKARSLDGNTSDSTLMNAYVYDVPDGQGLTEFVASVTVKASTGEEYTATKSIWVIDQQSYYGAANTIYVSNTLTPVDESTYTAAGAIAGATYTDTIPAYNEYDGKRVLFYNGDVFNSDVGIGIGQSDWSISSWGGGNAEINGEIMLNVNSSGIQSVASGGSFVKDADVVDGWCKNVRISGIRAGAITPGLSFDHITVDHWDGDYSNLTTPDDNRGRIEMGNSFKPAYVPSNGLAPETLQYSAGFYLSNSVVKGSSALSIITENGGSTGNIFDFVGGTSVTSIDFDSTTYSAGQLITLTGFGTIQVESNGDYVVTSPNYDHDTNLQIDILTDDGVKTFYTGQVSPGLNVSGIYAEIDGIAIINCAFDNVREHNLRIMGGGKEVVRDVWCGGNKGQREKHCISIRTAGADIDPDLGTVPANTNAFGGGSVPFGNEGIKVWGGQFRDSANVHPSDMSYFAISQAATLMRKNPTGVAAAAVHFTSNQTLESTDPADNGMKDMIVYDWYVDNDNASKVPFLLNNDDNQYRCYVVKAESVGAITTVTIPDTSIFNRDDVLEPFYRDVDGDLPMPI